jgi:hypothetical protein
VENPNLPPISGRELHRLHSPTVEDDHCLELVVIREIVGGETVRFIGNIGIRLAAKD